MNKKNNKIMFLILALSLPVILGAQSDIKVIAVINHSDWCGMCRAHSERAKATFNANNTDGSVLFLVNNITNDETKKSSLETLKKYGLHEVILERKGTAVAYFYNPKTKQVITQVSVAKPDNALIAALEAAKRQANK